MLRIIRAILLSISISVFLTYIYYAMHFGKKALAVRDLKHLEEYRDKHIVYSPIIFGVLSAIIFSFIVNTDLISGSFYTVSLESDALFGLLWACLIAIAFTIYGIGRIKLLTPETCYKGNRKIMNVIFGIILFLSIFDISFLLIFKK